jgi:asparagine synthase (glutamine-hydrolysing)
MCGIAGVLGRIDASSLERMASMLHHRGPDDSGLWLDPIHDVGLAHARLSILDLSIAGHQPMISPDGDAVLVYNGEIYNHLELRKELAKEFPGGLQWRGHSDTETLLCAFGSWGVERTVKKCRGMFAFALWNRAAQTLTLGRDRLGEKPLYYGSQGARFYFASELPAVVANPSFRREIDDAALGAYLRLGYVPAPFSIYRGIRKLPPGTLLTVQVPSLETSEPAPYWSLVDVARNGCRNPFNGSEDEAVEKLEELLSNAVQSQMLSDVPLGAFLSGGIDSSLITALLQQRLSQPISTFTIGFREGDHDEAAQARAVAKVLGTSHHELYLTSGQARAMIPDLPGVYGEPFADPSQIPTILVSKFARGSVTVCLSGDGGDECFCGYSRYHVMASLARMPAWGRRGFSTMLSMLSPEGWQALASAIGKIVPLASYEGFAGDKIRKAGDLLRAKDMPRLYLDLLAHWPVTSGVTDEMSCLMDRLRDSLPSLREQLMVFDGLTYLPGDVLCKVDRAAMSVSLETRIPLLDRNVVEFAWTLPSSMNERQNRGKWLLRRLLKKFLPAELVDRPKKGFAVPIADWLRGPLKEWGDELLGSAGKSQNPFLDMDEVRRKWREHQEMRRNWHYQMWNVLMLQSWLRHERLV